MAESTYSHGPNLDNITAHSCDYTFLAKKERVCTPHQQGWLEAYSLSISPLKCAQQVFALSLTQKQKQVEPRTALPEALTELKDEALKSSP